VDDELLSAALSVKRAAGRINVVIHDIGILIALPRVLETRRGGRESLVRRRQHGTRV
jgi:hypothetical protein